jgi:uncharacterized protein (TIGR02611 family)
LADRSRAAARPRKAKRLRKHVKRIGVFIVGWLVVIVGLLLVPLPGPGWAIVFVGLSILATEFAWAERLKHWVQRKVTDAAHRFQAWRATRKRRRLGLVDEVVEDVLVEVETSVRPRDRGTAPGNHSTVS